MINDSVRVFSALSSMIVGKSRVQSEVFMGRTGETKGIDPSREAVGLGGGDVGRIEVTLENN